MLELPMVIVDVQRGGPSTGLPTKTEQADLLAGVCTAVTAKAPSPCWPRKGPADCFDIAFEACRLAVRAMTPVVILSEGFLANSSEPWLIPDPDDIAPIPVVRTRRARESNDSDAPFLPYLRDEETLGRPWAIPGTPGLEHRIGGLAKAPITGNVSLGTAPPRADDPDCGPRRWRAWPTFSRSRTCLGRQSGDLLVLSWGGTFGAVRTAVTRAQNNGRSVAHAHLRFSTLSRATWRHFEPLQAGRCAGAQRRSAGLFAARPFCPEHPIVPKMHARPFKISEITDKIEQLLG
jgi:2-oxoglutarate ferredoxin oxidoreductase subunit alpha